MLAEARLNNKIEALGTKVQMRLLRELEGQGRKASGTLGRSVEPIDRKTADGWSIEIFHEDYGIYVNKGVKPKNIPFTIGGTGKGGTSEYIEALINYALRNGIADGFKEAKNFAFGTATVQKREGSPTQGSYRFSNNGRRTGWIDYTIDVMENEIEEDLADAYEEYLAYWIFEEIDRIIGQSEFITVEIFER